MSGKAQGRVYGMDVAGNEQSVLLAMSDSADIEGRGMHPSIDMLAWMTGNSHRTVQRVIKKYVSAGWLTQRANWFVSDYGRRYPIYDWDYSKCVMKPDFAAWSKAHGKHRNKPLTGVKLAPQEANSGCQFDTPPGDISSPHGDKNVTSPVTPRGDTWVSPNPSSNTSSLDVDEKSTDVGARATDRPEDLQNALRALGVGEPNRTRLVAQLARLPAQIVNETFFELQIKKAEARETKTSSIREWGAFAASAFQALIDREPVTPQR